MPDVQDLIHAHLFDQAPIMIAVLDPRFAIVEANAAFEEAFGPWKGKHCYEVLKGRKKPCDPCMAGKTFKDGRLRIHEEGLETRTGERKHFVTRVAPLVRPGRDSESYLIWMGSAVNEAASLQEENELLFERVPCYVNVVDRDLKIVRANRRMRDIFGGRQGDYCYQVFKRRTEPCENCPVLQVFEDGLDHKADQVGVTSSGEEARYVVTATPLVKEQRPSGDRVKYVIEMSTDVTHLHRLEREKWEAERLAAVGRTVAGLAHGIKNILMGLEGGVYVMESGLKRGQTEKVERGMQMLGRNVDKISNLVKDLLSFSKGRLPVLAPADPNAVVREIVELYREAASQAGVTIRSRLKKGLAPAPLDADGIHTCLANLVSNALDACQMSEKDKNRIDIRTFEKNGILGFEVADDGCGMDYEVKRRIFTTFFTTKGAGGTGIGLLTVQKIAQEHGGDIELESDPGKGTTFRILLSRERLAQLAAESAESGDGAEGDSSKGGNAGGAHGETR